MPAHGRGSVPVAREPTVSIQAVRGMVEAVERAGVPRAQLLRAAELEADQLEVTGARLLRSKVDRLCELAVDLTGDPALGLHWGERLMENAYAFMPVSHLIAHAGSLRQGLEALGQFGRLLSDELPYQLCERDGELIVRCLHRTGESLPVRRFTAEMVMVCFFKIIRAFSARARPSRVSFEYPAPTHQSEYTRVFERAVRFEQPLTEIAFDRQLLSAPSPHKDEGVHEALRVLAERRIAHLTQSAQYTLRVRELLVQGGWPRRMDMEAVARALGLSARSLRRRLGSEGNSYHDVERDALAIVAKHLLRDEQCTIQETAHELGFSDTTTFHRAFKRWTGMTPAEYRNKS